VNTLKVVIWHFYFGSNWEAAEKNTPVNLTSITGGY